MSLIVGLGNPGAKYERTRHNVGWRVIDELARRHGTGGGRSEKRALAWDGTIAGRRVKLAKPLTYMNRSGESVGALVDYYDIALDRLLVIHDDLDTPFGSLRLRKSGGHGGQNGIRSIIQHLGGGGFARLRFGIGRPPGKIQPVDFVLRRFHGDDAIRARELTERAADAVESWLVEGVEAAMSRYNGAAVTQKQAAPTPDLEARLAIALRARQLAPADPKPLAKIIAVQKKLGRMDEAVASHLELARLYDSLGDGDLATAQRSKAVSIRPDLVDVQRAIAEWHLAQGNPKKGVARYLLLAEQLRRHDIGAAMAEVERALAINPQHPKARALKAALLAGGVAKTESE